MTLILERVHSISIYFSVFVHMIPKRHFATVQIVPELVRSSFHSEWNSRSVAKFHSGIMSTQHELRSAWKIANRAAISGASGAWSGALNHASENVYMSLSIYHVNAEQTSLCNKTYSGMKVIPVSYIWTAPYMTEATGLMVCNFLLAVVVNRIKLDLQLPRVLISRQKSQKQMHSK